MNSLVFAYVRAIGVDVNRIGNSDMGKQRGLVLLV